MKIIEIIIIIVWGEKIRTQTDVIYLITNIPNQELVLQLLVSIFVKKFQETGHVNIVFLLPLGRSFL